MPSREDEFLEDLLNLMASRVHVREQRSRVHGAGGQRNVGGIIDDTGIGQNNDTRNIITNDICILDCGHPFQNNLGGQCHYCDALVCNRCIFLCSYCGHALCPQHTVAGNFSGIQQYYCRNCATEIARSLKIKAVKQIALSFFFDSREK